MPKPAALTLPGQTVLKSSQIDLESSEDDIQEIQQEISVLSTCDSPYVTQYKTSFLCGYKLWIVMEYLGGGSCLDLVGRVHTSAIRLVADRLIVKTRTVQ